MMASLNTTIQFMPYKIISDDDDILELHTFIQQLLIQFTKQRAH
jgi:hypothetical protein